MRSSPAAAALLRSLAARRDEIVTDLVETMLSTIGALGHDEPLTNMLAASVAENVHTAMNAIANQADLSGIDAPAAAVEYARRLGQREIPLSALLRAYRVGQARFVEYLASAIEARGEADPAGLLHEVVQLAGIWVDQVSEQVADAYERERAQWAGSKASMRQQAVRSLLTDPNVDVRRAEATLGYAVDGVNVAAEFWVDDTVEAHEAVGVFEKAAAIVGPAVGASQRLLVSRDARTMRAWFGRAWAGSAGHASTRAALERADLPVGVALGPGRSGLAGFVSGAAVVARMRAWATAHDDAVGRVVTYEQLAPLTLLGEDEDELAAFVRDQLGGLSGTDERSASLRESLLVFLEANRSFQGAAERLTVHRNTAGYRVRQALEARGRELADDEGALWLALTVCRWRPGLLRP